MGYKGWVRVARRPFELVVTIIYELGTYFYTKMHSSDILTGYHATLEAILELRIRRRRRRRALAAAVRAMRG